MTRYTLSHLMSYFDIISVVLETRYDIADCPGRVVRYMICIIGLLKLCHLDMANNWKTLAKSNKLEVTINGVSRNM